MTSCNFASAGPDENLVYGACRPGYPSRNPTAADIEAWLDHMEEYDVRRVCCLLAEKLRLYDGLLEQYEERFGPENVRSVPITDHDVIPAETFHDRLLPFLNDSVAREERVVVHCSAGIGRTGHVLALWLAHERNYTLEEAIETVRAAGDARRDPLEAATVNDLSSIL